MSRKTLPNLILALAIMAACAPDAWAQYWEAGMRENFITRYSYHFGSDSAARITRELADKGYERFNLHMRVLYHSNRSSRFSLPPLRTGADDLSIMRARAMHSDGNLVLKFLPVSAGQLGITELVKNFEPTNSALAIRSFFMAISPYLRLVKEQPVSEVVIPWEITNLALDKNLAAVFESELKRIKSSIGPKTLLTVEFENFSKLNSYIANHGALDAMTDKYAVAEHQFFEGENDQTWEQRVIEQLNKLSQKSSKDVGLTRFLTPACSGFWEENGNYACQGPVDFKRQASLFKQLKVKAKNIFERTKNMASIEILEAHTDFEPDEIDPRFLHYNPDKTLKVENVRRSPVGNYELYLKADNGPKKKACLFYDKLSDEDIIGSIHIRMLETLIGAFPAWKAAVFSLNDYESGLIQDNRCESVFYLSTNFYQIVPESFLGDLLSGRAKKIVWLNYNFSQLEAFAAQKNIELPFTVPYMLQADQEPSAEVEDPGFYRWFDYKGETFFKLAEWNPITDNFSASPEIGYVSIPDETKVKVRATARHSKTNAKIPYAVESSVLKQDLWYIGDSPFTFVHYDDRFLIFCDLLWDILSETAPEERIALLRLEDINPAMNLGDLNKIVNYLAAEKIDYSMALIPWYSNVFGSAGLEPQLKPIDLYPEFMGVVKRAQRLGASMIMHGSHHAVGNVVSGYDGESGTDYEFWLYPENTPLPFDSPKWVNDRLLMGAEVFARNNISLRTFEAPHYAASVMNYHVFAETFEWNYHRPVYFPFEVKQPSNLPERLMFSNCLTQECQDERIARIEKLEVEANYEVFGGMVNPFITYRDAYGQKLIPETLGMVDFAFYSPSTWRPISSPDQIIERAKKLKVIRGAVASFFWHSHILNDSARYYQQVPGSYVRYGGQKSLDMVINAIKDLGYKFVNIEDCNYFPTKDCK